MEATKDQIQLHHSTFEVNRYGHVRSRYDFYIGPQDISIVPFNKAVRWAFDISNYIRQFNTGQVEFIAGGIARNIFFEDGPKTMGSIEIDGQNFGFLVF